MINMNNEYSIVSVPRMVMPHPTGMVTHRSMPVVVGIHSALTCYDIGGRGGREGGVGMSEKKGVEGGGAGWVRGTIHCPCLYDLP